MKNFVFFRKENDAIKDINGTESIGLLTADCVEEISVDCITEFAGKVDKEPGVIRGVTARSFEKFIAKAVKDIESVKGFVVPMPECSELLWDESFEWQLQDVGDIYDIFDDEITKSRVRIVYYEAVENYIISRYIEPICSIAKKFDKKVLFSQGTGTIQYDFMYMVNPQRLINEGVAVVFQERSAENEAFGALQRAGEDVVLLIKPIRGTRAEYGYSPKKGNIRLENPALNISFEGTYYCEKLAEKKIAFSAIDEYTLENSAYVAGGKIKLFSKSFGRVIVCNGCMLTEMGEKIVKDAKDAGVSINSAELLKELAKEEWEDK